MEDLSEEVLRAILSFLSTIDDLKSVAWTCKRLHSWIFQSQVADGLFLDFYHAQFRSHTKGTTTRGGAITNTAGGRRQWRNLYNIRHCIRQLNEDDTYAAAISTTAATSHRDHQHHDHNSLQLSAQAGETMPSHHASHNNNNNLRLTSRAGRPVAATANTLHGNSTTGSVVCCSSVHNNQLQTIEVLPQEEEAEAILYDHPDFDVTDHQQCVGYFGFRPLHQESISYNHDSNNHHPHAATNGPRVAIWGDFAGLRIAPSLDALLNPRSQDRDRLQAIRDQKHSQVMDLLVVPPSAMLEHCHHRQPFFLGFASGTVMAVAACDEEFKAVSTSVTHSNEVTCLTILPSIPGKRSSNNNVGCLASACVDGHVYIYPDSLTTFRLDRKLWLNPDIPTFPIFTMSATPFDSNQTVLCLGGGQGLRLSLWGLKRNDDDEGTGEVQIVGTHPFEYEGNDAADDQNDDEDRDDEEELVDHNVTCVTFHGQVAGVSLNGAGPNQDASSFSIHNKNDLLVVGTSRGYVMAWDLISHSEDHRRPQLQLRYVQENAHSGSIESINRVGNMLFSAGGKDGFVKAFDIRSGAVMATLLVHPGRMLAPPTPNAHPVRLKCAVVRSWVSHERQSIICLCRDGHISEWSFDVQSWPSHHPSNASAAASGNSKRRGLSMQRKTGKRPRNNDTSTTTTYDNRVAAMPTVVGTVPPFASATTTTVSRGNLKPPPASSLDSVAPKPAPQKKRPPSYSTAAAAKNNPQVMLQPTDFDILNSILAQLPEAAKGWFNQIGFCLWSKIHRPVLVVSPLAVPPGPIREEWLAKYNKAKQRAESKGGIGEIAIPHLVFWYGATDPMKAYSVVPKSTVISYAEGCQKQYDRVCDRIQKRVDAGKSLKLSELEYFYGMLQLLDEVSKAPMQRSHMLLEFDSDQTA